MWRAATRGKFTSSAEKAKAASEAIWKKPGLDFPLLLYWPLPWGVFRGVGVKRSYAGCTDDRRAALEKYQREGDDLHAGRTPRPHGDTGLTLRDLCNDFLNFKLHKVQTRELTERSFQNNRRTTEFLIGHLGKPTVVEALRPDDFLRVRQELAKSRRAGSLGNEIGRITMDRDGGIKLICAAQQNGIKRYVMVSAMNAEEPQGVTKRSRPTCVPSLRLARRCGRACWNTRSFAQGH